MTPLDHLLYLLCVALACTVQNLTGFAFGLVLLGLAALSGVAPLPTLTHVVSVLVLVNAAGLFLRARPQLPRGVMRPTLLASLFGVLAGVLLLQWLARTWLPLLQAMLALTIAVAALDLLLRPQPAARLAPARRFAGFGLLSGLLGGLFSTAGPPLVYHFYRQPLPPQQVRDALLTVFALNALLRLGLMGAGQQLDRSVLWLSLEALPLVWLISRAMAGRPPPLPPTLLRRLVCLLLLGVAASLAASAWRLARA